MNERVLKAMRLASQVDDGYPSDRILLGERINVITFLSDTRLVKNQPCPDLATPDGLDHRRKLSHNVYQFAYLPGCAGAPGDLFVVSLLIPITLVSAMGYAQDVARNICGVSLFGQSLCRGRRAPLCGASAIV